MLKTEYMLMLRDDQWWACFWKD